MSRRMHALGGDERLEVSITNDPDEESVVVTVYRQRFGVVIAVRGRLLRRAVAWAQRRR